MFLILKQFVTIYLDRKWRARTFCFGTRSTKGFGFCLMQSTAFRAPPRNDYRGSKIQESRSDDIRQNNVFHWFMAFYKNFSIPSEKPPWPILFNSSNVGQENLDKTKVTQPPLVKLNPVQVNFTKKVYLAICSCSMVETNEILYILHCNVCLFEVLIMI